MILGLLRGKRSRNPGIVQISEARMKITCSYCKGKFDDTRAVCPYCGAANPGVIRTASGQPVTVDQLKAWYSERGLPPYEVTRFFIGENHTEPRAFGIYRDEATGKFVVYKNKADGSRAVRYEGTDEAYAVNELYQRLKQEIIQQRAAGVQKKSQTDSETPEEKDRRFREEIADMYKKSRKRSRRKTLLSLIFVFAFLLVCNYIIVRVEEGPQSRKGYYNAAEQTFYHADRAHDTGWFVWDEEDSDWKATTRLPERLDDPDTAGDFYSVRTWDASTQVSDFEDSQAYKNYTENQKARSHNSDSNWDNDSGSDYDWDSGSDWDSDSSDWDSDW